MFLNMKFRLSNSIYLFLLTTPLSIAGDACLYIALRMFGQKHFPATAPKPRPKPNVPSPESELRALKNDLDIGLISEEEYRDKRAEIIRKL